MAAGIRSAFGTKLRFSRQKGLEEAIEKLGAELHTEYVLNFAPKQLLIGYHQIRVRLNHGSNLNIRAQPDYWVENFVRQ